MAKEKLSEKAYEMIKDLIQNGEYPPGSSLPELELSQKLGISRTPIREALQRLTEDMIVTITPHLGAVVSTLDLNQLRDLYEMREAVEGMMARLLCRKNIPSQPFIDLFQRYSEVFKIDDEEKRHLCLDEINLDYAKTFGNLCSNKMLAKLYFSIDNKKTALNKVSHLIPVYPDEGSKERMVVLQAIIHRDEENAEYVARRRVQFCLRRILDEVMPSSFHPDTRAESERFVQDNIKLYIE